MKKILLASDISKVSNVKLEQVKRLIRSFQISEESFRKDEYKVKIKIFYDDNRVKNFLGKKIYFFQNRRI